MAQTIPITRTFKDVVGLTGGVNSYPDPQFVGETELRWAENAVNKGGIWQTRPGFDTIISLYLNDLSGDYYWWWTKTCNSFSSITVDGSLTTATLVLDRTTFIKIGDYLQVTSLDQPNDVYFAGTVTSVINNTITLTVSLKTGTGTFSQWMIETPSANRPILHPQFFTIFQPSVGSPQFVFGVSGAVFYCRINADNSIDKPRLITSINFDPNVKQICAASAVQTADLQNGAYVVIAPNNVLMMQDGVSRAAYWDGDSGGHLNPTKKWTTDSVGNTIYVDGYNQTRIGKWMAWSSNRLWVSNGNQVFASDLGDPLHFTEETVLVNVPSFTFPEEVTGLIDRGTSGIQQNLVFVGTQKGIYTIQSGIVNRSYWINTADFVRKVFAGVSCVSHKSMITHMGLLYWYSDTGIVAFDSLGTVISTQSLPPIDNEMAYSKLQMANDRSAICAGSFDSYVWWSVPVVLSPPPPDNFEYFPTVNGRVYNGHTQVLDRIVMPIDFNLSAAASFASTAWQGVWTGLRPVEWATAKIGDRTRTFCLSMDYDGVIRIWEGFNGNRADNNYPIKWALETRAHAVTETPFSRSIFRYFRLLLTQIYGALSMRGSWKGLRGKYHELLNTSVHATPGSVLLNNPNYLPIVNDTATESFSKQTRDIVSKDNRAKELCTSAGVESPDQDDIDRAFSLLLEFEGIGAVKAYRLAVDYNPDNTEGAVVPQETGQRVLPEASCPAYYPNASQSYSLVKRDSKEVLMPVVSQYIDTGYTPYYPPL